MQVKRVLVRALSAAGLLVAVMGLGTAGVEAQGVVKAQYGDWQMSCDTPPGASFQQCAIIQNVTAEDQPNVGLSVIVLKTADQKAKLLRVLAPLGVLLPNGLGLNIDGKDMGRVAFVRCLPNGCVAEVAMDDALIKTLSSGKSAMPIFQPGPSSGVPPGPPSFMSYLVFGPGSCGTGFSPSAATSAPVKTPSTPGMASAVAVLMETMRAWGWGERTMTA